MELIKIEDLPQDKRVKMQNGYDAINLLIEFQNRCKPSTFNFLFKERSEYLWEFFVLKCNRDILTFIGNTDDIVGFVLVSNLLGHFTHSTEHNPIYSV